MDRLFRDVGAALANLEQEFATAEMHFCEEIASLLGGTLQFLNREPGAALPQASRQVVDDVLSYMNAPPGENHGKLLRAAVSGLALFRSDPGRFFARQVWDLGVPGGLPNHARLVGRIRQATRRLEGTLEEARAFRRFEREAFEEGGTSKASALVFEVVEDARPDLWNDRLPNVTPPGSTTNCHACAIAVEKTWSTGKLHRVPPARTVRPKHFQAMLAHQFRETAPPFTDGPDFLRAARDGIAIQCDKGMIEKYLDASSKRRGIVIAGYRDPDLGKMSGHIFNARTLNGEVVFWDGQKGRRADVDSATVLLFYPTN